MKTLQDEIVAGTIYTYICSSKLKNAFEVMITVSEMMSTVAVKVRSGLTSKLPEHIAGKLDRELNLAVWRSVFKLPN